MPKIDTTNWTPHKGNPHPVSGQNDGPYSEIALGDAVDLSQYGVRLEKLPPGSRSSHRHWHESEDELIYMVSGHLVLIEDEETALGPGDAAGWKAGLPVGHCLENRSQSDAVVLVIGTRSAADIVHYPDHDITLIRDEDTREYRRSDGTRTDSESP